MSDGTFDNSGSKFSSSHLLVKQHRPRDLCGQSERCGTQKNAKLQMTISLTIIFFLHLQRCCYSCYCLFLFPEARAKGFPKDLLPNSTRHFLCTTSSTSFTSQTSSTSPTSILHHVHHLQELHQLDLHHKHHLHHCQTIYRCSSFTYLLQNSSDVIYTVVLTQELIHRGSCCTRLIPQELGCRSFSIFHVWRQGQPCRGLRSVTLCGDRAGRLARGQPCMRSGDRACRMHKRVVKSEFVIRGVSQSNPLRRAHA